MKERIALGAFNRRQIRFAPVAFLCCAAVLSALTQEAEILLPAEMVLPPGVSLPVASNRLAGTNTVSEAKSPEAKLLQDLLKLKFDRSAPSILNALAGQFDESKSARTRSATSSTANDATLEPPGDKAEAKEVEQFKQFVIVGDWEKVGEFLRGLTNDHGKQVYRYLLRELPNASRASRGPQMPDQPPMPMPQPGGPGPATLGGPTLVVDDVLGLAEAAPHELEVEDARLLGQLLGRLLARGDALEPLLPKLDLGVKGLGGTDSASRGRAAEMLVAANRLIEAGPFLMPAVVAREKKDWAALDLRARQLIALGKMEKDSKSLTEAWEINQFILASPDSGASNREPALRRSFELMPLLARGVGTNWLRRSFQDSPNQGLVILAAVSETVQKGFNERATEQRQKNLELQKQVVETFLGAADPSQAHWRAALNLLAQNWMQEAAWAKQRYQPPRNYGPQYDEFGNMRYYEPYPMQDGNQVPAIPFDQVVASAPDEAWLAQLDGSLRLALRALMTDLCLKAEKTEEALQHLEAVAGVQPRGAADLANEFLRVWTRMRNPTQQPRNMAYGPYGPIYYGPGSPYGMRGGGISLTRAMQARHLRELSGLLHKLESLKLPSLNDDAVVGAFAAAHSPAEVFRIEDIEAVFGSLDRLRLETLAGLTQTMRERLAAQWRQPRVQQEAKTQRTDKQIEAEMLRGYDVVLKLLEDGLKREPDHWQLNLSRAAVNFDLAEFQYGKKVDLAIYVEKREEAFKGFERAASLYGSALSGIEEKEQSPRVYQQWFNANLGASDLAYVTRQQEPETNQLQRIRAAILSLPGGTADRHMSAFAQSLGQSVNSLRPELKPRYLRAGLRVVGDHPDAEEARKLARYYDDLLQEIECVVRLDGDAAVGHTRPFGVFVSLRHTADIEREAGGFARYLRNLKKTSYAYYNPYGQQQRNFVEDFDKLVREKLVDKFDVKFITFLDEKVQSRGYGRPGWRETPLAYLLIQAKDASVDQLPALHMDLDFVDPRGQVVLPVASQITLLDARPARVAARPVADLEVTQILDDREIAEGLVTLEIKARGKGLIPELAELVKTNFTDLRVEEISDQGLSVAQVDTESDELAPVTERNWMLKLRIAEEAPAPASLAFHFPQAALAGAKMVYKRYADADLVEVEPKLALAGLTLRPRPWWHWLAMGVGLLAVAGGGAWWWRRHKPETAPEKPTYVLPEPATPFTVMNLLRRMQADASLRWTDASRAELAQNIQRLESHFFARERNGDPEPDLTDIGRRWVELAGNGK